MTRLYMASAFLISAVLALRPAYSAQPPDVVTTDPFGNTAMGSGALSDLTSGTGNTAAGGGALYYDTSGFLNTAIGFASLEFNTTGNYDTATGMEALFSNTTGNFNTASGISALYSNSSGSTNSAFGAQALYKNTTGANSTAAGYQALALNTTGQDNTASGASALYANTTGTNNTGVGVNALGTNQSGSNNIAVGFDAGYNVRGGRYNIEIGNAGNANDAGTIRIGTSSQQSATFVAGITNAHLTGSAVYISSSGQLGVLASSERYKTAIASMGSGSKRLKDLRPVTFQLKTDPKAGIQYGLIAEEVARVYPELVIRDAQGQIEGVRYEELAAMLLNEVQQQARTLASEERQLAAMHRQVAALEEFRRSMQGAAGR